MKSVSGNFLRYMKGNKMNFGLQEDERDVSITLPSINALQNARTSSALPKVQYWTNSNMPKFEPERFRSASHHVSTQSERGSTSTILRKRPDKRTDAELERLAAFLSTIAFFADKSERLRLKIAQICTLCVADKDHQIFSEGDPANDVYVVLTGGVANRLRDYANDILGLQMLSSVSMHTFLGPGAMFGGAALVEGRDIRRQVTKVATADETQLLRINRDDYLRILKAQRTVEVKERFDFVRGLPVFEQCTRKELLDIARKMQLVRFKRHELIVKQGEIPTKVYFIQSGQCHVIKRMKVQPFHPQRYLPTKLTFSSGGVKGGSDHSTSYRCDESERTILSSQLRQPTSARPLDSKYRSSRHRRQRQQQEKQASKEHASGSQTSRRYQSSFISRRKTAPQIEYKLLDLGVVRAKAHFGEIGALVNAPSPSFVYSETVCVCLVLSNDDFHEVIPDFVKTFMSDFVTAFYPAEPQVQQQYLDTRRWSLFKKRMIQRVQKKGDPGIA